jgi:hypothetical protein
MGDGQIMLNPRQSPIRRSPNQADSEQDEERYTCAEFHFILLRNMSRVVIARD